jgi:hypothetical protein
MRQMEHVIHTSNNRYGAEKASAKEMKNKLEQLKGDVCSSVNSMFGNITGVDPADVMSNEEINKHLA